MTRTKVLRDVNTTNDSPTAPNKAKYDTEITFDRGTTITNFYAGQSVLITGGTGFLGKILVEKLLRSCPDISMIYLIVRAKKNKNVTDRVNDLFNNTLFDLLRRKSPEFRQKIFAMSGDCGSPGLGLCSGDRERLVQEVSIVFHCAATVRFEEKLNIAMAANVRSTLDMIDLCKSMKRFITFIHVSTAYANCHESKIEEIFYPHPAKLEELNELLSSLDDEGIRKIRAKIVDPWPNTYSFTKALAEAVVKEKNQGLSIGIFRPAIVASTAFEPVPGWVDNFYTTSGVLASAAMGIMKTIHCDPTCQANIVPVDLTVNALIASAWDVANQPERRNDKMLIYNYVSTVETPITWRKLRDVATFYGNKYPLAGMNWTMSLTLQKYKTIDYLSRIFLHYVPAILIDLFYQCQGQKSMLVRRFKQVHNLADLTGWFRERDWIFINDNVQNMWNRLDMRDKQDFRFTIKGLNWNEYFENYMKGLRIYLLKDDLSTLEKSRKKLKRLRMIDTILKSLLVVVFLWFVWKIINNGWFG